MSKAHSKSRFTLLKLANTEKLDAFADDVRRGLTSSPKFIPPMYFYDSRGSELFEQICRLPEYYPTRTEFRILQENASAIADIFAGKETVLIELGSGSASKSRLLLEEFSHRTPCLHFVPVDISESILVQSSRELLQKYPNLKITALAMDFENAFGQLQALEATTRLFVWLGSSIGNFEPSGALRFLRKVRKHMSAGDCFLLGMDLQKDVAVLENAYNDAAGITAEFNLNLLRRINRELEADFDLNRFRHRAFYNAQEGRIEMHLESRDTQRVPIRKLDLVVSFRKGETIHTENSYKFTLSSIRTMAHAAGFRLLHSWTDKARWFSLNLISPLPSA